jgi:hypothetical protein
MDNFTPEELAILRDDYHLYCAQFREWHFKESGEVMSFDDWWRAAADEAKDHAKYNDN